MILYYILSSRPGREDENLITLVSFLNNGWSRTCDGDATSLWGSRGPYLSHVSIKVESQ